MPFEMKAITLQQRTFVALAVFAVLAFPQPAMAEATTTFGSILCNAGKSFKPLAKLMSGFAYLAAAIMLVRGVMFMLKHLGNPNEGHMTRGFVHGIVAGLLVALPAVIKTAQRAIKMGNGSGGLGDCTPGSVSGGSGTLGLDLMMKNFVSNIADPMTWLVSVIAMLVGIFYVYRGLLAASKVGTDPRAGATHIILVHLLVGAALVSLGGMLPMVERSIFSSAMSVNHLLEGSGGIINWSGIVGSGADTAAMDTTVAAMLTFVQVIGTISFLRGWMILKKAVEGGQATIPQGLTHIIGGAMAINIELMLKVFDWTFGTGLVN